MKHQIRKLLLQGTFAAALLTVPTLSAQTARFFRISGPAATTITDLRSDGTLVWSNSLTGTNYTVQTAVSLVGGTNWVDYVQLPVTNPINTNLLISYSPPSGMALIPAGTFQMGDAVDGNIYGEAPVTSVYVSAFYMDQYDVTYSLWQSVYNWATNQGYSFDYAGSGKAANHPVQTIDWFDCVKWCNARSEMEGKPPAYYTSSDQTTVYRTGQVNVDNSSVKWNGGYRLPTEAEWEKAARGGASGQRFPWGNTISESQANYYSTGTQYYSYDLSNTGFSPTFDDGVDPFTSPVDFFAPNEYGLYDMAGNVWQWCWDWYGTYAGDSDPHGPTSCIYGTYRVGRGGGWLNGGAGCCRTAYRFVNNPYAGDFRIGFRSVLPSGQ